MMEHCVKMIGDVLVGRELAFIRGVVPSSQDQKQPFLLQYNGITDTE